jgi:hypothetical protein
VAGGKHCGAVNQDYEVEFRETIVNTIPSLIELTDGWIENVRWWAVGLIRELANHSEWKWDSIAGQLSRFTKLGFMKSLRA